MVNIQIDDQTAKVLEARAAAAGLSVEDYLRSVVETRAARQLPPLTGEEFDRLFDELSVDASPLPADFSRADIYLDHD